MRVTSGQVTQADTARSGGAQTSALGLQSQTFGRTPRESVAASRIETETESDFWRELRASLEAIIGQHLLLHWCQGELAGMPVTDQA